LRTLVTGLAESGRIADRATGSTRCQVTDNVDGQVTVDAYVGCIRAARQIIHMPVYAAPQHFCPSRVNRPDLTLESHAITLADHLPGFGAAENGNGSGL
jgi:hypothetical protein